jgi:ATP-dependent RNA helicase DeaD
MPKPILMLTKKFQNSPELIKVVKNELTSVDIEQFYFFVAEDDKTNLMRRLIEMHDLSLMLVFCNTKQKVDEVVEEMQQVGIAAEGLHGNLSQAQRNVVMGRFRKGLLNVLVATDVAARGIDVNDVEAVFNYDIPLDPEYYVHRIGRTGRAGKKGISFTFVLRREIQKLRSIEQYTKVQIQKGNIPTNYQLAQKRKEIFKNAIIASLAQERDTQQETTHLSQIILQELIEQGHSPEHIAQKLLALQFEAIHAKGMLDEIQPVDIQAKRDKIGYNKQYDTPRDRETATEVEDKTKDRKHEAATKAAEAMPI